VFIAQDKSQNEVFRRQDAGQSLLSVIKELAVHVALADVYEQVL